MRYAYEEVQSGISTMVTNKQGLIKYLVHIAEEEEKEILERNLNRSLRDGQYYVDKTGYILLNKKNYKNYL